MEDIRGNSTHLYNLAPNGLKVDQLFLTKVPNVDNSDYDYLIEYLDDFLEEEKIPIGHCELINGNIWFDKVGEQAKTMGPTYKAIRLLTDWIEQNLEE